MAAFVQEEQGAGWSTEQMPAWSTDEWLLLANSAEKGEIPIVLRPPPASVDAGARPLHAPKYSQYRHCTGTGTDELLSPDEYHYTAYVAAERDMQVRTASCHPRQPVTSAADMR